MSQAQPSDKPKTVLAPCMGVGKIVAAVTRRASYIIKDQCPDVEILSLPALLAGDPAERKLVQENPSIIIDGCALRCTAHIYRLYGIEAVAKIEVNQVMKERKIGPGKTRKELEEVGKKLSNFTAERVLQALQDEGLSAGFVAPDDLAQPPPDAGTGCPHRLVAAASDLQQACSATHGASADAAVAEAAETTGVCQSGPAGEQTAAGKYKVNAVTILPCQGIKRTGGRVTQRAAYHVVEDRFLGKSQVLCISALAAGVQEDVDMLENYPTVAVNGCGLRCASIAAEHHGMPAVAHVDLQKIDPDFKGEEYCLEPDLTETEAKEALKLADAIGAEVENLLGKEIEWQKGRADLHGLVHEPGKINALTGYTDPGKGFLVKLAKAQLERGTTVSTAPAPVIAAPAVSQEVSSAQANCEYPGLKSVIPAMFKPRPRGETKETKKA
ncbi:MAG TPA: putative zinc-binding protein [Planctomycetota bacterium]|nr:putative zinc-binding protein [Planctomycetota bacterium]